MKLYWHALIMLIRKFILRQSSGQVVHDFAEKMGIVYIKVAQIIAMQNYGEIFTEQDRQTLSEICDHCNPISFGQIQQILVKEYGEDFRQKFSTIDEKPLGSASISQVHRAVLKDGSVVALKIKRQDVAHRIDHDIRQIKRFIRRFGRLARFRNFLGSDQALELYIKWIKEETDFINERQNLLKYQEFAESVNGRIAHSSQIKVPKVYTELCTENVIVMEYIDQPTVNRLELTSKNKQRITYALNSYLSLTFYALLHGMPVTFHGDPHSGNIYLDEQDNLGFLDMGLIFSFSEEEASFIRELFLNAYAGRADHLVEILIQNSEYTSYDQRQFLQDIQNEAARFRDIPVTQYFVEMINIFTKYNIAPPTVLFKAAKAFMALFGINNFIENYLDTQSLLANQVRDYYLRRTASDLRRVANSGLKLIPDFLVTSIKNGPVAGLVEQLNNLEKLNQEVSEACVHCREVLECWRVG